MSKTKTYIVPVVHHVVFGVEVRVEADSLEEAKCKAIKPEAQLVGEAYSWDRMDLVKATLGDWDTPKIEE